MSTLPPPWWQQYTNYMRGPSLPTLPEIGRSVSSALGWTDFIRQPELEAEASPLFYPRMIASALGYGRPAMPPATPPPLAKDDWSGSVGRDKAPSTKPGWMDAGGSTMTTPAAPPPSVTPPMAAPPKAPIRAVKMPDGSIKFTNIGGAYAEGTDISTQDAGREIRQRDLAAMRSAPPDDYAIGTSTMYAPMDGAGLAMRDAVRNAALQTAMRENADATDIPGGASMLQGTPDQQWALRMEDVLRTTDLTRAENELEFERMPREKREAATNKELQTIQGVLSIGQPQLARIQQVAAEKKKLLPRLYADEKQRAMAERAIDREAEEQARTVIDMIAVSLGVRMR